MDSAVREISSPVAARTLVKPRGETAKSYGYTGEYVPSRRRIYRYVPIPSFAHHCLHVSSWVLAFSFLGFSTAADGRLQLRYAAQTPRVVGAQMNLCICNWNRASILSANIHSTISRGSIRPKMGER